MKNIYPVSYLLHWYAINDVPFDTVSLLSSPCGVKDFTTLTLSSPAHINKVAHYPVSLLMELYKHDKIYITGDVIPLPNLLFASGISGSKLKKELAKVFSGGNPDKLFKHTLLRSIDEHDFSGLHVPITDENIEFVLGWLSVAGKEYVMNHTASYYGNNPLKVAASIYGLNNYEVDGSLTNKGVVSIAAKVRAIKMYLLDAPNDGTFDVVSLLNAVIQFYARRDAIPLSKLTVESLDYEVPEFLYMDEVATYGVAPVSELLSRRFKYPLQAIDFCDAATCRVAITNGLVDFNNPSAFVWDVLKVPLAQGSYLDMFTFNHRGDAYKDLFYSDMGKLLTTQYNKELVTAKDSNRAVLLYNYVTLATDYILSIDKNFPLFGSIEINGGELLMNQINSYLETLGENPLTLKGFIDAMYQQPTSEK